MTLNSFAEGAFNVDGCALLSLFTALLVLLALTGLETALAADASSTGITYADSPDSPDKHFHPKGKPPSEYTLEIIRRARASVRFDDTLDFGGEHKGFLSNWSTRRSRGCPSPRW